MLPLRGIIRSFQLLADDPRRCMQADALLLETRDGKKGAWGRLYVPFPRVVRARSIGQTHFEVCT
jgi:hypothetical protein